MLNSLPNISPIWPKYEKKTYFQRDCNLYIYSKHMRQTAYIMVDPSTVNNFASLLNCTAISRLSGTIITLSKVNWRGHGLGVRGNK